MVLLPMPTARTARKWALWAVIAVLLCYVAYVVREIWLPLGLALILAMVLSPIIDRMEAKGWNRASATAFVFISFLLVIVGLAILATPFLIDEAQHIQAQLDKFFPDRSQVGLVRSFKQMNAPDAMAELGARAVGSVNAYLKQSTSSLTELGLRLASNLIWVVIVPIVTYYIIRDYHIIITKTLLIAPPRHRNSVQSAITEITTIFGKFLRGLGVVSMLNGIATWAMLVLLHVPSAVILGFIAGILYSVPYVGAILTVVLTAIISFLGGGFQLMLVAVGASLVLHQIIFDQIVSPRILGGHVGLHPILSIIALLAGNLLLGIVGMILAVPVAACIQIAVLAVMPKLAVEVDLPPLNLEDAAEADTEAGEKIDASEQMKQVVAQTVDVIEDSLIEPDSETPKS
jgi:predicted PurR-regulated permease PerM